MTTTRDLIMQAAILVERGWELPAEEFEAALAGFVADSTDKIAALRAVYRAAEGRAATCKAEADLYAAAAKRHKATAEQVRQRAQALAEAAEAARETLPGVRLQVNGGAAPLQFAEDFDVTLLPMAMQRVTVEPDNDAIRRALGAGQSLPGVTIGERTRSLRWTEK